MTVPLWYRREINLGARGPDVRIVRRKLGFTEDGPYDRAVQSKVMGVARKRKIESRGEVNEDIAEELGPAADESQLPTWWDSPEDYEYQLGDMGEDVRSLRYALGFADNDDRYRADEEAAVRRFQSARSLPVTGRVNAELAKHLGEA